MADFIIKFLFLLVFLAIFFGACASVQVTVARPKMRYVVVGLFGTIAALVMLLGLLSLAAPAIVTPRSGRFLLVLGVATLLPLLKPVRRLMARLTPFDASSMVDISGLVVICWILVIAGTFIFTINLDKLAGNVSITVADALTNVIAFPALALSLIGLYVTRDWREALARLGLCTITPRQAALALGLAVPLLALSQVVDVVGRALQPDLYAQVERIYRAMAVNVTNPFVAATLALSAGIGEEILFRGAIQPRYGILLTSLVFALLHAQYGASFAVGGVFFLSLLLGYERKYLNTTACIITHAAYNLVAFSLNAGLGQ